MGTLGYLLIGVDSSKLVGFELEICPSEEVRNPGAIVMASIVAMCIVSTRLFRHLLN